MRIGRFGKQGTESLKGLDGGDLAEVGIQSLGSEPVIFVLAESPPTLSCVPYVVAMSESRRG